MALATYSDILTQVALWLARAGDPKIVPSIPDWLSLCEQRIAYGSDDDGPLPSDPLRIRAMETSVSLPMSGVTPATAVSGSATSISLTVTSTVTSYSIGLIIQFTAALSNTGPSELNVNSLGAVPLRKSSDAKELDASDIVISASYNCYYDGTQFILMPSSAHIPLPPNYLGLRSDSYIDISPRRFLDYVVPDEMNRLYQWQDAATPTAYTIEADAIRLAAPPDQPYVLKMLYYKKFTKLSASNPTNWLLTNAPAVYLFGTLIESAPFIGADSRMQTWHAQYRGACNALQRQDNADRHSGALLTARAQHWNP